MKNRILLIGQGIAGSLLAHVLLEAGADIAVIDHINAETPSRVAAGIINPVTGKRFVKSWRFDTLYEHAQALYREMEVRYGISIWEPLPIIRLLEGAEEINNWDTRCGLPEYAEWLSGIQHTHDWSGRIRADFKAGMILHSGRVHFNPIIAAIRERLTQEGRFQAANVAVSDIPALCAQYKQVICCDGYGGLSPQLFPHLPWQPAKGEALVVRLPGVTGIRQMLKRSATLVPLEGDLFWVGGTYSWDLSFPLRTEQAYRELCAHIDGMLETPYEVVAHLAGIRPSVRTRRPLLGAHPSQQNLFIFNGMGAKGASLTPWCALHMRDFLLEGRDLEEVSIAQIRS